ncbi:MAG: lysostaphin resistance A-like protein [Planctomycetaceae bacterium]
MDRDVQSAAMTLQQLRRSARARFLALGILFEGGLVVVAYALGWLMGVDPLDDFAWRWDAVAWGVAGALGLFVLFLGSQWFTAGPVWRIQRFLIETLGPLLDACRWYDLVLLAALAGVTEELLFRGVLQPWLERHTGAAGGLVLSNVAFGLAHAITPTYALLAGVLGIGLGLLLHAPEERNLLVPMIAHGLYDYLAFLVIRRQYRREERDRPPFPAEDD